VIFDEMMKYCGRKMMAFAIINNIRQSGSSDAKLA
jgi:hypothetical protein